MAVTEEYFASRPLASEAAAQRVAAAIQRTLVGAPEAAIVATGGSTPEDCYRSLADTALSWDKVSVMLSDERCVPPTHEASNEGLLRRSLATGRAVNAKIVSIYDPALPLEEQCGAVMQKLNRLPLPFSISLLGMGADGHFASLFADCDQLEEGLDPDGGLRCMLVRTAASPHPRITLTMAALLQSDEVLLFFFGDTKRKIYELARLPGSRLPVSQLLHQQHTPVHVIWAR